MRDTCKECGVLKEGPYAHKSRCETGRREIGAIFSRNPVFSSEPAAEQETDAEGRSALKAPSDTVRPAPAAAPDAQTLEIDAFLFFNPVIDDDGPVESNLQEFIDFARSLEREAADLRRQLAEGQRAVENRMECEVCDRQLVRDDNCVCLTCWNKVNAALAAEQLRCKVAEERRDALSGELAAERADNEALREQNLAMNKTIVEDHPKELAAERAAREAAETAHGVTLRRCAASERQLAEARERNAAMSQSCDESHEQFLRIEAALAAERAAREAAELALRELEDIYPNFRQLIDGFMTDPHWNQEWDEQTRNELIAWRNKHNTTIETIRRRT